MFMFQKVNLNYLNVNSYFRNKGKVIANSESNATINEKPINDFENNVLERKFDSPDQNQEKFS